MKVKIFNIDKEYDVNHWLSINPNIKVISTHFAMAGTSNHTFRSLVLFYEELVNKPVTTTNEQPKDGIWYEGRHLPMSYEELADLLCHFRDSGNEQYSVLTRKKCSDAIGTLIPITDY